MPRREAVLGRQRLRRSSPTASSASRPSITPAPVCREVNPSMRGGQHLVGAGAASRPRAAGRQAGARATGRCRCMCRRPGWIRSSASCTSSISGASQQVAEVQRDLALDHAVDAQRPARPARPAAPRAPCRPGRSSLFGVTNGRSPGMWKSAPAGRESSSICTGCGSLSAALAWVTAPRSASTRPARPAMPRPCPPRPRSSRGIAAGPGRRPGRPRRAAHVPAARAGCPGWRAAAGSG